MGVHRLHECPYRSDHDKTANGGMRPRNLAQSTATSRHSFRVRAQAFMRKRFPGREIEDVGAVGHNRAQFVAQLVGLSSCCADHHSDGGHRRQPGECLDDRRCGARGNNERTAIAGLFERGENARIFNQQRGKRRETHSGKSISPRPAQNQGLRSSAAGGFFAGRR